MPEPPGTLVQLLFAAVLLVPMGLAIIGSVYLIGLTIADSVRRKRTAHH